MVTEHFVPRILRTPNTSVLKTCTKHLGPTLFFGYTCGRLNSSCLLLSTESSIFTSVASVVLYALSYRMGKGINRIIQRGHVNRLTAVLSLLSVLYIHCTQAYVCRTSAELHAVVSKRLCDVSLTLPKLSCCTAHESERRFFELP